MKKDRFRYPLSRLPQFPAGATRHAAHCAAPDDDGCHALWDKYGMLPNIRRHSALVAHVASVIAERALELGFGLDGRSVRSSALLHDLAKTWSIKNGGSHSQLGASWVMAETGCHGLARGVMLHVYWPWELPACSAIVSLPFLVMYADKRVQHDKCVTLDQRYVDLLERYGVSDSAREAIGMAHEQGRRIERALSAQLGWDLHEYSFDCGGLVP